MLPVSRFKHFINQHNLFSPSQGVLLAVSGGRDSVLMACLFAACDFKFAIAHCNFSLRGDESDADEHFTKNLAEQLNVPFYSTRFQTNDYAKTQHISIQMAARHLRYKWLEEVRSGYGYDYIALAHHQNDVVETILLNLVRGTGIAGMHGILPKRNSFIRPLLFLTRDEITAICSQQNLSYRDDSSNFSSYYARNKIRLEVVPALKELNPSLEETFKQNARRFADMELLLDGQVSGIRKKLFKTHANKEIQVSVKELQNLHPLYLLLFELFRPYNFTETVIADLVRAFKSQPGKVFRSATHQIVLDRDYLLINSLTAEENELNKVTLIGADDQEISWKNNRYSACIVSANELSLSLDKHIAQLDLEKLQFPLQLRSWNEGDSFFPLGMKGRKKISDFFQAEKIALNHKNNIALLVNGNDDILWIAGYRVDERYKVKKGTEKIFIFEQQKEDGK